MIRDSAKGQEVHVPFQQSSLEDKVKEAARRASDNASKELDRRVREFVEHHAT